MSGFAPLHFGRYSAGRSVSFDRWLNEQTAERRQEIVREETRYVRSMPVEYADALTQSVLEAQEGYSDNSVGQRLDFTVTPCD